MSDVDFDRTCRARRFTDVRCHEDRLDKPLHWRKPRRVFVNSMSDLFHEDVPDEFIDKVFGVMAWARHHTYQVLTKRPKRMRTYVDGMLSLAPRERSQRLAKSKGYDVSIDHCGQWQWPLPNVVLCVSCENQPSAEERIPLLLDTPAVVRGMSAEPLLGPMDFECFPSTGCPTFWLNDDPGLDWVIVGGESGPKARPCDVEWIRSIVQQCQAAGVPVFVKQLGARVIANDMHPHCVIKDPKGGDPSEWPHDLRVREHPSETTLYPEP